MSVLSIVLTVLFGFFILFRLVMHFNHSVQRGRGCSCLLAPLFFIFIFGMFAVTTEFITNKGPNDLGAFWHASHALHSKYGSTPNSSYRLLSYDKDADASGSGTYHIKYRYGHATGTILCHYDKPHRKFDSDQFEQGP